MMDCLEVRPRGQNFRTGYQISMNIQYECWFMLQPFIIQERHSNILELCFLETKGKNNWHSGPNFGKEFMVVAYDFEILFAFIFERGC